MRFIIKIFLFILSLNLCLAQLNPGQISLAGWGYYKDDIESKDYHKKNEASTIFALSYNINHQLSIDTRLTFLSSYYKRTSYYFENLNVVDVEFDEIWLDRRSIVSNQISLGVSYFLDKNFYLSAYTATYKDIDEGYVRGDINQNYNYNLIQKDTISGIILGYRMYLNPSASLDIGYNIKLNSKGDPDEKKLEFLFRMFL